MVVQPVATGGFLLHILYGVLFLNSTVRIYESLLYLLGSAWKRQQQYRKITVRVQQDAGWEHVGGIEALTAVPILVIQWL